MASQFTGAYIIPQPQRPPVFGCQHMGLADQVPTFQHRNPRPDLPDRQMHDRYEVERLAAQHVLEVPANPVVTDQLLADTERVIQVQQLPIQVAQPRFFAVVASPGELEERVWVELEIPLARLLSNGRFHRAPGDLASGTLTYDCVSCQGSSYEVSFWNP